MTMRHALFAIFLLIILSSFSLASSFTLPQLPVYYAEIKHILTLGEEGELVFSYGEAKEIIPPPPPDGYMLYYMEITFLKDLPETIAPLRYDKVIMEGGKIKSLITYNGSLKLATLEEGTIIPSRIRSLYLKREWVRIGGEEISFYVEPPKEPFSLSNLTVKITLDNNSPFFIKDIIGPDGTSIKELDLEIPEVLKMDPKSAEFKAYVCGIGKYKLELGIDKRYKLSNKYLLIQSKLTNYTINPGSIKDIKIKKLKGWNILGSIIVIYSLYNETDLRIESDVVDYLYSKTTSFKVSSPTFLVPPINLNLNVKVFIAYGEQLKISNPFNDILNIICIPLYFRDIGYWTPKGVVADISYDLLTDAINAYLIVQTPFYGKIIEVKTPSGKIYFKQAESLEEWENGLRSVGIRVDKAYVQVKYGKISEVGTYFFKIDWKPVIFELKDSKGRPLSNAKLTLRSFFSKTKYTNTEGRASFLIYYPGSFEIEITFKDVIVKRLKIGTLTSLNYVIKCPVYDLNVIITGRRGQILNNVKISLISLNGKILAINKTDNGVALFTQIPKGDYLIKAYYKRLSTVKVVNFRGSTYTTLVIDVLFELPYLNLPISTMEFVASVIFIGVITVGYSAMIRRRSKEIYDQDSSIELH